MTAVKGSVGSQGRECASCGPPPAAPRRGACSLAHPPHPAERTASAMLSPRAHMASISRCARSASSPVYSMGAGSLGGGGAAPGGGSWAGSTSGALGPRY